MTARMSMELSNYLVSWVITYLGDLQPTYIGVIIYLLSTMDIPLDPEHIPSKTFSGAGGIWNVYKVVPGSSYKWSYNPYK